MLRLWTNGHAACGPRATARRSSGSAFALAATLAFALATAALLVPRCAQADAFVRRLAERALERGMQQEARGDIAQALTSYDEAVRTDSTLGAAALRLGSLRERMGDHAEAELLYTLAVGSPDSSADALYARALLRTRAANSPAQERDRALADLAQSVTQKPAPERLRLLGGWYVERRTWPAALAVWRALLSDAEARGDEALLREARVTLAALSWLAVDTDPVLAGATSPDWVRRSLARTARAQASAQGVRKLTP